MYLCTYYPIFELLSNEKLKPLNIPDKVEISLASPKQIEEAKSLDNGEWEFLPGRLDALRQSDLLFLLYENNSLAGYLEAVCPYKNYCNIRNVFVHEDFRGKNFGSLLAIYYANYCLNNGFVPHYGAAMSVYSENVAIKSGFEQTKRYHFFALAAKS